MFAKRRKRRAVAEFWSWFQLNQKFLEEFIKSDTPDIQVYKTLLIQLGKVSEHVTPILEVGQKVAYKLSINGEGDQRSAQDLTHLTAQAPVLKEWELSFYQSNGEETVLHAESSSNKSNETSGSDRNFSMLGALIPSFS
ncbi:hypothetical protein [Sanyastnella coralliicola]|uniref:hypothetical protein n=1 Tax=Sanyastnella coralliicola TaxID=3069118 RepID=UPI0027B9CB75|nr:hypothetical protein [Longitalea sp. SCSIO 12813]